MARHNYELIGVVSYSPELSYAELYELEEGLIVQLRDILTRSGADHLDFWGAGDALQFQCAFPGEDAALYGVCDEIIALLPPNVTGRLVSVDKQLTGMNLFCLAPDRWKEEKIEIAEDYYRRFFRMHRP